MELTVDWHERCFDCFTSFISILCHLHTISSHIYLQRTEENSFCVDSSDSLGKMLGKVEVHIFDTSFVLDEGVLMVGRWRMFDFKNLRESMFGMVMKLIDMGGCLFRLSTNIFNFS